MERTRHFSARSLLLSLVAGLLIVGMGRAQSPTVPYQGYLTDADGTPLGGTVNLAFALYSTPAGGTALWKETQTNVPLNEGVFSVLLGSVEALVAVDFEGPRYLGVAVNGGAELAPRVLLGASPTSLYAHDLADGVAVRSLNGLTDDVTLQAGDNVTLTGDEGTIRIDAETFTLPFEGTNETATPAFRITSSAASAIVANSEGGAPAISASNNSTGAAASFGQVSSTSAASAIEAFSFTTGATGTFSHFGSQGYAGVFRSTSPQNNYPALVAGKEDLDINSGGFFNDGLIVRGEAPVLGIYGRFQQDVQPGLVLAGVDDDGDVVDKWGIVREFFGTQRLMFTYGLNEEYTQNATIMTLSSQSGVSANQFIANNDLGGNGTPLPGGHYADNVVYAWAHVNADGSVAASFGCTVLKTGTGQYRITYDRALTNGAAPVVSPLSANDPVMAIVAPSGTNRANVKVFDFVNGQFQFGDRPFFIQVVGRP